MKVKLVLAFLLIMACGEPAKYETRKACNVIKAKDQPMENRLSGADFVFGSGSITKTQTVYYFYFENGSSEEVNREVFFRYDEGDKYCKEYQIRVEQ